MKHRILYATAAVICLACAGCSDYLKEYSRDLSYASNWKDLDEVLIGNGYLTPHTTVNYDRTLYPYLFVMDDDAEEMIMAATSDNISSSSVAFARAAATWQRDPFMRNFSETREIENTTPGLLYEHIAYVNTIINYIDEFPNDPIEELTRIRGEGQFLRAAYYLMANNLFGWAYDRANNGSDPGIPLKTVEWVVEDKFGRAPVSAVYDLIVNDLEEACYNLRGVKQKNFYRTNELAAHILLSRVYLYMEEYDKAISHIDQAMTIGCPLAELNRYNTSNDLLVRSYLYNESNPEIVFTMGEAVVSHFFTKNVPTGSSTKVYSSYMASGDLLDEYRVDESVNDLRLDCYFWRHPLIAGRRAPAKNWCKESYNDKWPEVFEGFLIRTAEAYLNKAEALAMKGETALAAAVLRPLLETRYATGMLPRIDAMGRDEMIDFVRAERRRELCFEGHRWPDLRRYAVNTIRPMKKSIRHTVYDRGGMMQGGTYAGYFELKPYGEDEGWIMPFPRDEIAFNNGLLVNPERPDRFNSDPNR